MTTFSSSFVRIASSILLLTAACGDDGRPTDTGSGDSAISDTGAADSTPTDTGADTGTGDTGAGDTGAGDTGAGDGSAMDSATSDATTDGSTSSLVISEVSVGAWANCMPIVPADPLRFFIELRYDNSAGAAETTAIITAARLTFDDAATTTTDIDFDVEMVTVAAGATETQMHGKTTSTPVVASCTICSSERMVAYELTFDVGGATQMISGTTSFICTF